MTETNSPSPLWQVILVWLIILLGVVFSYIIIKTKPQNEKKAKPEFKTVVKTEEFKPQNKTITIKSRGIVEESQITQMAFQVGGKIVSISKSFEPGQFVKKGEVLAELSKIDFEAIVENSNAKVAQAKLNLLQEEQNKMIAAEDWKLYPKNNQDKPSPLLLKEPQLILAQKILKAAISESELASVNLERTVLKAPFDGIIAKRNLFLGSIVNGTTVVGELISSNECWVRCFLPIDTLNFMQKNGKVEGAKVEVVARSSGKLVLKKEGAIFKILPRLESQTRLAQLMIKVADPYSLNEKTGVYLFNNLSVELQIMAANFSDVIVLKREYLRENNSIWLYVDGALKIEPVDILYKDDIEVILNKGEWIKYPYIVSDLSVYKNGMKLNLDKPKKDKNEQ